MLAREAQTDRWAALLDVAPFPENVADEVFTSPYYERLEAALARHEAAGHDVTTTLTALAPAISPGEDQADPAAVLAKRVDHATTSLAGGRTRPRRVGGLIPTPAEPIPDDMQTALTERQRLIEAAARRALQHALDAGESWTKSIGRAPAAGRARSAWLTHASTVALYRQRYGVDGSAPLGNPRDITKAQQAAEYHAASAALRRTQSVGEQFADNAPRRDAQRAEPARRL